MIEDNPVTTAVDVVGGPTQASFICRVSAAAIYKWRKEGWVQDSRAAVLLARATQEKGTPISVAALAGLEVHNGNGTSPSEERRGRRVARKGAGMSATYLGSQPLRSIGSSASLKQAVNG